jgi:hypothetical protein
MEIQIDYILLKEKNCYYVHPALIGFVEDQLARDPLLIEEIKNEDAEEEETNRKVIDRLTDILISNARFHEDILNGIISSEERVQLIKFTIEIILIFLKKKFLC